MPMRNITQRLLVSAFILVIVLSALYFSNYLYFRPFFALLTAGAISAGVWEFYKIGKAKGYHPLENLGIVTALAYGFAVFLSTQTLHANTLPEIVLAISLITGFLYFFSKGTEPYINLSITFFGIVYIAIPLSCMISINYLFPENSPEDGRLWLLYLLVITKMTDTGAYFVGKTFGTRKMTVYISPKKTWEGAFGGFFTAIFVSLIFWFLANAIPHPIAMNLSLTHSLFIGAVVGILAQLGDLAESLLKRDVGFKDSSKIPGLGGFLDIFDSLIFTTPFIYLFLKRVQ